MGRVVRSKLLLALNHAYKVLSILGVGETTRLTHLLAHQSCADACVKQNNINLTAARFELCVETLLNPQSFATHLCMVKATSQRPNNNSWLLCRTVTFCRFGSLNSVDSVLPILSTRFGFSHKVVDELSESIERERVRGHDARKLLEGAVSKGGVVLPEVRRPASDRTDHDLDHTFGQITI